MTLFQSNPVKYRKALCTILMFWLIISHFMLFNLQSILPYYFCIFKFFFHTCMYSGTSLIRSSKMRTPPSTGHHQESSCFCFVCFCQINLGRASGLVACARMAIITLYSVLHYIVLVSLASTTRRKRSVLTLEKKLEIIGELKKGKSLRYLS